MKLVETNLWELVMRRSDASPDKEMLVDEQGRRITFSEYMLSAEEMAAGLNSVGVQKGDVVAWELPTWIETVILAAALSRLGAIQNPIIAIYREREVRFCVKQANATVLITPSVFKGFDFGNMGKKIESTVSGLRHLSVSPDNFPKGDITQLPNYSAPETDELRWLCYTSGTTADPKGACLLYTSPSPRD